jgi:integrase
MPPWLTEYLRRRMKPEGLIVVSPRGGPYAPGATRAVILAASADVGVYGLSPHRIRGSFATRLSVEGVPLPDIQEAMRHKDSKTTLGYIEKDMGRVVKAQEEIARRAGHHWRDSGGARSSRPQDRPEKFDSKSS